MKKTKQAFFLTFLLIATIVVTSTGFFAVEPAFAAGNSITINNGANFTNTTAVTLTLSTDSSANITQMSFSNDNSTWSNWQPYATSANWTLTEGDDGIRTVYVQFEDNASQITTASASITLDQTPPIAYPDLYLVSLENRTLYFDGGYSEDNYGIVSYVWNFGDGTPTVSNITAFHAYASAGNYTGMLTVTDIAGNSASELFFVRLPVDTTTPTPVPTAVPTYNPQPTAIPTAQPTATATPAAAGFSMSAIILVTVVIVVAVLAGVVVIALSKSRLNKTQTQPTS